MPAVYSKRLTLNRRYLYVPVGSGDKVTVQLSCAGRMVREFQVELGQPGQVNWWAWYDLSPFAGEDLVFAVVDGEISAKAAAWLDQAITLGDSLPEMEGLYQERYRPQIHFTPRRGWNNDPNGLVYASGVWHMFFQHNPFGTQWGNMHWGHAVSRDLVHWEELDEALYQRSLQDMAFSGGGLVDENNTAGFQTGTQPPLVVAFTSTGRGECLAYSNDGGQTLVEWEGNPFLAHAGRDPKILWHPGAQKWVLIVYEEMEDGERGYAFYDSPNLKTWERHSFLPGYYECPELFRLPIDGDPAQERWVIHGCLWEKSLSTCLIGDFDGRVFAAEEENFTAHYGPRFYASQVFGNAPGGRVIMVGWLQGAAYPEMPFSQGMTVPLELSLRRTSLGTRLCFQPVRELESLRLETTGAAQLSIADANRLLSGADSELLDLELRVPAGSAFTLDLRGYPVVYDPEKRAVSFAGRAAPVPVDGDTLDLRVLVDRSVSEVFAARGAAAFAEMTLFADLNRPLKLEGEGLVESLKVHRLKGIW